MHACEWSAVDHCLLLDSSASLLQNGIGAAHNGVPDVIHVIGFPLFKILENVCKNWSAFATYRTPSSLSSISIGLMQSGQRKALLRLFQTTAG